MTAEQNSPTGIVLSVIAAAYNEEDNVEALVQEIHNAITPTGKAYEIVICDDGSADQTVAKLQELKKSFPELRVLKLRQHTGQTPALDALIHNARGQYIAALDADLQNDPKDIPRMLTLIEQGECDMVNGWRKNRRDPWIRLASTKIANGVRNWLTNEHVHDSACGLKVYRREVFQNVRLFHGLHRFLPTLAKMEGYRVKEIEVNHRPRTAGIAKYGVWNRVFKALRDTFAIRWMQRRIYQYEFDELD